VGQRTFETRFLYLILAEKLFTLPAANEMLPLSALFAGKYREAGQRLLMCPIGPGISVDVIEADLPGSVPLNLR
jgi:hypothetical protein